MALLGGLASPEVDDETIRSRVDSGDVLLPSPPTGNCTLCISSNHSGRSTTKGVVLKSELFTEWSGIFAGEFRKLAHSVHSKLCLVRTGQVVYSFFLTVTCGWQGQDGKFSTVLHEAIMACVVYYFLHTPAVGSRATDVGNPRRGHLHPVEVCGR